VRARAVLAALVGIILSAFTGAESENTGIIGMGDKIKASLPPFIEGVGVADASEHVKAKLSGKPAQGFQINPWVLPFTKKMPVACPLSLMLLSPVPVDGWGASMIVIVPSGARTKP